MAKKLTRRQEVELALQKEDAIIIALEEEDEKDRADTDAAIEAWKEGKDGHVKGIKGGPATYNNLRVSWEEDGEEYSIGPVDNPVDIHKFKVALRRLPLFLARQIRSRLPLQQGAAPKSPRELTRDLERRHQQRLGKIFHAKERMKTLEEMIPAVPKTKPSWDEGNQWKG